VIIGSGWKDVFPGSELWF